MTSRIAFLAALSMSLAVPLAAQVELRGVVLDDLSERPLAGARVFLINRYNKVVDYAVADAEGQFRFDPRGDARVRVEATAVGFIKTTSPELWMVQNRAFAELEIRLRRTAVLLAPLEIVALAPPEVSPKLEAVEYRRLHGFGVQITREEIEQRQPMHVTDILVELPGVYAERRGSTSTDRVLYMQRALPGPGGGRCPLQIFVDGMLATRGLDGGRDVLIDDLVSPLDVETIEVFKGLGTVPPEFLNIYSRCGVIAIWTKRSLEGLP